MSMSDKAAKGREMFREDLTNHLKEYGITIEVTWLEPDPKAGCVRFGLADGRSGNVRPGDVGGWKNATITLDAA